MSANAYYVCCLCWLKMGAAMHPFFLQQKLFGQNIFSLNYNFGMIVDYDLYETKTDTL